MRIFGTMLLLVGLAGFATATYPGVNPLASAPEIDPGSATTALALVSGGMMVIHGRRKK